MTGSLPEHEVDHRDGDGLNNRWDNIREATSAQNKHNRGVNKNNTTGFKGVYMDKRSGRYVAQITIDYKGYQLGRFYTAEEAHACYCAAAEKHFGEFARTE
jgi:hypothetical protein